MVTESTDLPKKVHFRIDEIAKYFDVEERTVYNWCATGKLKSFKVGGTVRVKRIWIIDFEMKGYRST